MTDEIFMRQALRFAEKGKGWTNPNPMVGALIVKKGRKIGWGYHRKVGLPHAEIEALNSAKTSVRGATLYVNLEPCSHSGRTPPCADQIIKAGIKRVVCALSDPNHKVFGRGIERLKRESIEVKVGILEKEARNLNEAFFTYHEKKRPFVAIKFAASLDGKIASRTGDSKWITNEKSRNYARSLRGIYQAILIGIDTVISDNPHLGIRYKSGKDPIRIILDSKLRISLNSLVLRDANVIVVTTRRADQAKKKLLIKKGITLLEYGTSTISIYRLLEELYRREIISILVEGGSKVFGSFVDERLVDKVYAFHAPIIIGGEEKVTAVGGQGVSTINQALKLQDVTFKRFNDNILTTGYVR